MTWIIIIGGIILIVILIIGVVVSSNSERALVEERLSQYLSDETVSYTHLDVYKRQAARR